MEKIKEEIIKELRLSAIKEKELFGHPEMNIFHINGYTLISLSRDFYIFTSIKDNDKKILNELLKDDLFNYFNEYDNQFGFFVYYECVVEKINKEEISKKKNECRNAEGLIDVFKWNEKFLEYLKENVKSTERIINSKKFDEKL